MNAPRQMRTESPIEAMLLGAVSDEIRRCRLECRPVTQVKVGPYRVDIMVELGGRKLVIECDGAAFHAATKDQIERDKRRDRYFAAHGISVMRFTGSEINRSSRACAAEVGAWLEASTSPDAASVRKSEIMAKWDSGDLTRLQACRLIRRERLVNA